MSCKKYNKIGSINNSDSDSFYLLSDLNQAKDLLNGLYKIIKEQSDENNHSNEIITKQSEDNKTLQTKVVRLQTEKENLSRKLNREIEELKKELQLERSQ